MKEFKISWYSVLMILLYVLQYIKGRDQNSANKDQGMDFLRANEVISQIKALLSLEVPYRRIFGLIVLRNRRIKKSEVLPQLCDLHLKILFHRRFRAIYSFFTKVFNHHFFEHLYIKAILIEVFMQILTVSCMHHYINFVSNFNNRAYMTLLISSFNVFQHCFEYRSSQW